MSFLIDNWMLISVVIFSGAMLVWPMVKGGAVGGISPAETVNLMNREKAAVVDVCEPNEYAAGHIVGAKNVPLGQLEQQLAAVVKKKDLPLVVVCASGMRSKRAVAVAEKLGYTQVKSMNGGMGAWRAAGLPVQKG